MDLGVARDPPGADVINEVSRFELEPPMKGTNVLLAGIFGNDTPDVLFPSLVDSVFTFGMVEGGGIAVSPKEVGIPDSPSGPGSLNTEKPALIPPFPDFELEKLNEDAVAEDEEATRLLFPACFNVVPVIFFISGMFSFTLVFLVPKSCHVPDGWSGSSVYGEVELVASTKTRSLDELEVAEVAMGIEMLRGVCPAIDEEGGLREVVVSAARGF